MSKRATHWVSPFVKLHSRTWIIDLMHVCVLNVCTFFSVSDTHRNWAVLYIYDSHKQKIFMDRGLIVMKQSDLAVLRPYEWHGGCWLRTSCPMGKSKVKRSNVSPVCMQRISNTYLNAKPRFSLHLYHSEASLADACKNLLDYYLHHPQEIERKHVGT